MSRLIMATINGATNWGTVAMQAAAVDELDRCARIRERGTAMDLERLARLAWTAGRDAAEGVSGERSLGTDVWENLHPGVRARWRAAADAVRMVVEPASQTDTGPAALRERLVTTINATAPYDMGPADVVERARAFESYILGTAQERNERADG